MFREMRRAKQQVSQDECKRILRQEKRAAFSVIGDDGYPYTVPIDFYYDEKHNIIYFHGAKSGHKADAIKSCNKVCFTVWNQGFQNEEKWEWNATSVVVFGRAKAAGMTEHTKAALQKLAEKYYPTQEAVAEEMSSPSIEYVQIFAIEIEHMTGKLVNER